MDAYAWKQAVWSIVSRHGATTFYNQKAVEKVRVLI
jgi:hypothetical protein